MSHSTIQMVNYQVKDKSHMLLCVPFIEKHICKKDLNYAYENIFENIKAT